MPREMYTITVEVLDCVSRETAIATASAYLAYGDQTDTIGPAPAFERVEVSGMTGEPTAVHLSTLVTVTNDDHRKRFMDELANLSKVLSVEKEVTA